MKTFLVVCMLVSTAYLASGYTVGQSCSSSSQCNDDNSMCKSMAGCRGSMKCVCKFGYVWNGDLTNGNGNGNNGSPSTNKLLGDSCSGPSDCALFSIFALVECSKSACSCPAGYNASLDKTGCYLSSKKLHAACTGDDECPGAHSTCVSGACACDAHFDELSDGSDCRLNVSRVYEACDNDVKCSGSSTCVSSNCTCPVGTIPTEQRENCVTQWLLLGDVCDVLTGPRCLSGTCKNDAATGSITCQCDDGYVSNDIDTSCDLKHRLVGETCFYDSQCPSFSEGLAYRTVSGSCACVAGFKPAIDKNSCELDAKAFNDSCIYTKQCLVVTANSVCDQVAGKCQCPTKHVYDPASRSCVLDLKHIGETCTNLLSTSDGNFMTAAENAALNMEFSYDQCFGMNTMCNGTNCVCMDDFISKPNSQKTECVVTLRKVYEVCFMDSQCVSGATCDTAWPGCVCPPGYKVSGANDSCTLDAKALDQPCDLPQEVWFNQCTLTAFTVCSDCTMTCQCQPGYIKSGSTCMRDDKSVNEHCDISAQCPTGSVCDISHHVCTCNVVGGFMFDATGTSCVQRHAKIYDMCMYTVECPASATCQAGTGGMLVCHCKPGYSASATLTACTLDMSNLRETCVIDAQCKNVANSACNFLGGPLSVGNTRTDASLTRDKKLRRVCFCNPGYVEQNGVCVLDMKTSLSEPCFISQQCPGNNVACANSFCQCDAGYRFAPTLGCLPESAFKLAGQACVIGQDVCPEHSTCKGGYCLCNAGYRLCDSRCLVQWVFINDACLFSEQCTWMSNVNCTSSGSCSCSSPFVPAMSLNMCANNVTAPVVLKLLDHCSGNSDCFNINNAECGASSACSCVSGYTPSMDLTRCYLADKKIRDSCISSSQCPGQHSSCDVSGTSKCVCDQYFAAVADNTDCWLNTSGVSDPCTVSLQCLGVSGCPASTVCMCPTDTVPSEHFESCVWDVKLIGANCTAGVNADLYCSGISLCKTDSSIGTTTCQCPKGYRPNVASVDCDPIRRLVGDTCDVDEQCPSNSEGTGFCWFGICQCLDGFKHSAARDSCVLVNMGFNKPCDLSKQCLQATPGAFCLSGHCVCPKKFTYDPTARECVVDEKMVGDTCTNSNDNPDTAFFTAGDNAMRAAMNTADQCMGINTVCGGSHCVCTQPLTMKPNSKNTDCDITLRKVYETCTQSGQCVPGAHCDIGFLGRCVCDAGYTVSALNDSCSFDPRALDQPCSFSIQCSNMTRNSECSSCGRMCQCQAGYARGDNNNCLVQTRALHQHCDVSEQCLGGSTCDANHVCNCDNMAGFFEDASASSCSLRQAKVFDSCNAQAQCIGGSTCTANVCHCPPGYVVSATLDSCAFHTSNLHETCIGNAQCSVPNSWCNHDSVCLCKMGYLESSGACVLDKKDSFSKTCFISSQCPSAHATCGPDNLCHCNAGYRYDLVLGCTPLRNFKLAGEDCTTGQDVCPDHSACNGVCQCDAGYQACGADCNLAKMLINDACDIDKQCPKNSTCLGSKCTCYGTLQASANRMSCVVASAMTLAKAGEACAFDFNCYGGLRCINGACGCDLVNYEVSPDMLTCIPTARNVYDACTSLSAAIDNAWQCPTSGVVTVCQSSKCACAQYYVASAKNDTCKLDERWLNETCDADIQCLGGATCQLVAGTKRCACGAGKVPTEFEDGCVWDFKNIGEACNFNEQCYVDRHAYCGAGKLCACRPQFVYDNVTTMSCVFDQRDYNETCTDSLQCHNPAQYYNTGMLCTTGICKCPMYYQWKGGYCSAEFLKVNDVCEDTVQCMGALTTCKTTGTDKLCQCTTSDYEPLADLTDCTLKMKKIEQTCNQALVQCPTNGYCNSSSMCQCYKGYVPDVSMSMCLLDKKRINEQCQMKVQCVMYAECYSDVGCQCDDGYEPNADQFGCKVINQMINDTCYTTEQCPHISTCDLGLFGVCTCPTGYLPAKNMKMCLPDGRALDQVCEMDIQCQFKTNNSRCDLGCLTRCVCSAGYVAKGGQCKIDKRNIMQSCMSSWQCPDNAFCNGARACECNIGYLASAAMTSCDLQKKKINEMCIDSVQCPTNAYCLVLPNIGGVCGCNPGHDNMKGTCVPRSTPLFYACEQPEECARSDPNSLCENTYSCRSSFSPAGCPDVDLDFTVLKYSESVQPTLTAWYKDARFVCICAPGYYVNTAGKCTLDKKKSFDEACLTDEQCPITGLSTCNTASNLCQCNNGYEISVDSLKCDVDMRKLTENCYLDKQCTANAVCDAVCKCGPGYSMSGTNTCALDTKGLSDACSISTQCPNNGKCNAASKCECNAGYNTNGGSCVVPSIGDSCTSICPTNAQCGADNKCQCNSGFLLSKGACMANINAPCSTNADCATILSSVCTNGICKCAGGSSPIQPATGFGFCGSGASTVAAMSSLLLLVPLLLLQIVWNN